MWQVEKHDPCQQTFLWLFSPDNHPTEKFNWQIKVCIGEPGGLVTNSIYSSSMKIEIWRWAAGTKKAFGDVIIIWLLAFFNLGAPEKKRPHGSQPKKAKTNQTERQPTKIRLFSSEERERARKGKIKTETYIVSTLPSHQSLLCEHKLLLSSRLSKYLENCARWDFLFFVPSLSFYSPYFARSFFLLNIFHKNTEPK